MYNLPFCDLERVQPSCEASLDTRASAYYTYMYYLGPRAQKVFVQGADALVNFAGEQLAKAQKLLKYAEVTKSNAELRLQHADAVVRMLTGSIDELSPSQGVQTPGQSQLGICPSQR
jgi:hypothetical protein